MSYVEKGYIMTRKDAIKKAMGYISKSNIDNKKEILKKLELCVLELPYAKWSKEAIFDACNQFTHENNGIIRLADFANYGLPAPSTIENRFKISLRDFRDTYYPIPKPHQSRSSPYWLKSDEEMISDFITEFNKIKPRNGSSYNKLKNKSLPTWITVGKRVKINKWLELLKYCNLKPEKHQIEFKVTATGKHPETLKMLRGKR